MVVVILVLFSVSYFITDRIGNGTVEQTNLKYWIHSGFDDFSHGDFGNGGGNIYVNANGVIEIINNFDVNNDGYVDIVLANAHDYSEQGPTLVFHIEPDTIEQWSVQKLSGDNGWMSKVVDLDEDGFSDLVTANSQNGVSSDLNSYVYCGGEKGFGTTRTDLPTIGAYDVAIMDINRDGRLDLIFPSSWYDSHNPAHPMLFRVYLQEKNRKFKDTSKDYGIWGTGAVSIAVSDLNDDGNLEIVVANYRTDISNYNTDSYVYWGTPSGVDSKSPLHLPTYRVKQVILEDLNKDGNEDIIFCGHGSVRIYWNLKGNFDKNNFSIVEYTGYSSVSKISTVRAAIDDVNGDKINDLIMVSSEGVQIRSGEDLSNIINKLSVKNASWVTATDIDGNGRVDLVVSKHHDDNMYSTKSPIFWNEPPGFSEDHVSWVPTQGAIGNTTGDLDGDGRHEVIFNNTMLGHVKSVPSYIYLGNEEARYGIENRLEFDTSHSNQAIVADLNLDEFPEVIFTIPKGVRVFNGTENGPTPNDYYDIITNQTHFDIEITDFNRDGFLDILSVNSGNDISDGFPNKLSKIHYGSSKGFSKQQFDQLENRGNVSALGDFNKDGFIDIIFHDKRNLLLIYLGSEIGYSKERIWELACQGIEDSAALNVADINNDGWLDIIVGILGHRRRHKDTLRIFYGSSNGFSSAKVQELMSGYSSLSTGVADFNNDGNLDLVASAYASPITRTLPAQLFYGDGNRLDFENPFNLHAYSSCSILQIDLNHDGWIDIILGCHRDGLGHNVDSLIYWNSPDGFKPSAVTRIPGLGPHSMYAYNHGNAFTREPFEQYISPPFNMGERTPSKINWESEETQLLEIKFQLRWANTLEKLEKAKWLGPSEKKPFYEKSGDKIQGVSQLARWIQYKAILVSPYGCGSPKLYEVRMDF